MEPALDRSQQYPLGASITLEDMNVDPYPIYSRLRESEPITWSDAYNMYLATRYEDVQAILRDTENFVVGTEHSTIMDTFGEHMLTTEGEQHDTYKKPLLPTFRPGSIRALMEQAIRSHCNELIDGFASGGKVELRSAFASRLPIKTVLSLFGLSQQDETLLRGWYDAFEKALANFTWDPEIRAHAKKQVAAFHDYLQVQIDNKRQAPDGLLLDQMLSISEPRSLTDEEVRRNASIIFFGGISTVEALTLNAVYTLGHHPQAQQQLLTKPELMPQLLDEVVRFTGPVQSASRHVVKEVSIGGVNFQPGDTVNCMLASANRDATVFTNPDTFDFTRPELRKHVGFAIGSHNCLGSHLAKAEAGMAVEILLARCPGLHLDPDHPAEVRGYEFRQPRALPLCW